MEQVEHLNTLDVGLFERVGHPRPKEDRTKLKTVKTGGESENNYCSDCLSWGRKGLLGCFGPQRGAA